jgi:hypothetical protein
MKLTNAQLEAVVNKIYKEVCSHIDDFNKVLETEESFNTWKTDNPNIVNIVTSAIEYSKAWKELGNNSYYIGGIINLNAEEELRSMWLKNLPRKTYPYKGDIKDKILIHTIEGENLDNIIKLVIKEFV